MRTPTANTLRVRLASLALTGVLFIPAAAAQTQDVSATFHLELLEHRSRAGVTESNGAGVVMWLTPLDGAPSPPVMHPRLVQKDKRFSPHMLVVPVGTSVEFPNQDPFFHNVFSLFNGKRFDLGLYESGSTRYVRFQREGISYIFCNIHPEMSAVIIALATPYYAVSRADGRVTVRDVPVGEYELHVWAEGADESQLKTMARHLHIGTGGAALGVILLTETTPTSAHKNKFGEEYPPSPSSPPAYGSAPTNR